MLQQTKNGVIVYIKVIPKSSFTQIAGRENDYLKIRIKGQPKKNKANIELVKFLADLFDLAPSQISILQGQTSRLKKILLNSCKVEVINNILSAILQDRKN